MRTLSSHPRTGAFTTLLSLLIVLLFAYANLLCVAGGTILNACESDHCAGAEAAHHDEAPAHPAKDCSKDTCFCLTMNTVVPQPTIPAPNHAASLLVADFAELHLLDVMPVLTTPYEHGPPAIPPPDYLFGKTLSPRAPPLGV